MDRHPLADAQASTTLAATRDSALVAAFVPGLPNSVLFQMVRMPIVARPALWLHALYREGDCDFDATARIDAGCDDGDIGGLLLRFIRSDECLSRVVEPIAARVSEHFRR